MRAALAFCLAAVPIAAGATPEQDAVAECIRNMPTDELIYRGSGRCLPPAEKQKVPLTELFPTLHQQIVARRVVNYRIAITNCPSIVQTPKARRVFESLLNTYIVTPPNVPALKAYIAEEVAKEIKQVPPVGGWCEEAKILYGDKGRRWPGTIANRDGSPTTLKCERTNSCAGADDVYVHAY